MTFNPDNLVYFYLILALLAIPFVVIAIIASREETKHPKPRR